MAETREKFTVTFARPGIELYVAKDEDGKPRIGGYAATFTGLSEDLGGFRTRIARNAFDNALAGSDVRFLVNHDPNLLLGRTRSGTLSLAADDRGLSFEATPPDTPMAAHYLEAIRRGDMDGCSFSCTVKQDHWDLLGDDAIRTILEVGDLYDVGPVAFPAFPDTSVSATLRASIDAARALAQASLSDHRRSGRSARRLRLRLELSR